MCEAKNKDYYLKKLKASWTHTDPSSAVDIHWVVGDIGIKAGKLQEEDGCNVKALEAAEKELVGPLEGRLLNLIHPEQYPLKEPVPSQNGSTNRDLTLQSAFEFSVPDTEQESVETQVSALS
jgi:hypothetical protein